MKSHFRLPLFPSSWSLVFLSVVTGVLAYAGAELLLALINLLANLLFAHRWSVEHAFPIANVSGWGLLLIPIFGSLVLGVKARFVDERIRGHGIPEAIDCFHNKGGAIPPRLLFLRPLASAISIGSGGPYGAEGPVIGLGGAIGSVLGQFLKLNEFEKQTLLGAGATAGIAAVFGTPVGAVFLVIELFIRSHSIKSLLPVALASLVAYYLRVFFHGEAPLISIPEISHIEGVWFVVIIVVALLVGVVAALTIHWVEFLETMYEKLEAKFHVHWMWWPVIGIMPLAVAALWQPRLLGPSYDMITALADPVLLTKTLVGLAILKGVLWSIAVSSRTTGGTLAPLLVMGGGIGAAGFYLLQPYFLLPQEFASLLALLSMGAFFGAMAGAPVSATFLVLEMTGNTNHLPAGLLCSLLAILVTKRFASHTIMSTDYR